MTVLEKLYFQKYWTQPQNIFLLFEVIPKEVSGCWYGPKWVKLVHWQIALLQLHWTWHSSNCTAECALNNVLHIYSSSVAQTKTTTHVRVNPNLKTCRCFFWFCETSAPCEASKTSEPSMPNVVIKLKSPKMKNHLSLTFCPQIVPPPHPDFDFEKFIFHGLFIWKSWSKIGSLLSFWRQPFHDCGFLSFAHSWTVGCLSNKWLVPPLT